jgi:hypothetical protein
VCLCGPSNAICSWLYPHLRYNSIVTRKLLETVFCEGKCCQLAALWGGGGSSSRTLSAVILCFRRRLMSF